MPPEPTADPHPSAPAPTPSLSHAPTPTDSTRHARFDLDVHSPEPPTLTRPPSAEQSVDPSQQSEKHDWPDASQATLAPYAELGDAPQPPGASQSAAKPEGPLSAVDIEHVYVENDPREWARSKKDWVTDLVSNGAFTPTLAASRARQRAA